LLRRAGGDNYRRLPGSPEVCRVRAPTENVFLRADVGDAVPESYVAGRLIHTPRWSGFWFCGDDGELLLYIVVAVVCVTPRIRLWFWTVSHGFSLFADLKLAAGSYSLQTISDRFSKSTAPETTLLFGGLAHGARGHDNRRHGPDGRHDSDSGQHDSIC